MYQLEKRVSYLEQSSSARKTPVVVLSWQETAITRAYVAGQTVRRASDETEEDFVERTSAIAAGSGHKVGVVWLRGDGMT